MSAPKKTLVVGAFAAALAGGAAIGATLGVPALSSAQAPGSIAPATTAPTPSGQSGQPGPCGSSGDLGGFGHDHGRGDPGGPDGRGPNGENALTGADADKAKAAALAAVPGGTVERVSNDTDGANGANGAFEAHVTKSDGSEVEVQLDKDFQVLAVDPGRGPGRHGFGGPGGHGDEAPLTGSDADKAKAAALAAVPGGTVRRVERDGDGVTGSVYEAHVTKVDSSEVKVKLDKDFQVLAVKPGHRPGGHGH